MKINVQLQGEQELSQRLVALAEMPGFDLVLDEAAAQAYRNAKQRLLRAGHPQIADSLQTSSPRPGIRNLTAAHPAAWHVDSGTRKAPAVRWRQAETSEVGAKLTIAVSDFIRRHLRKLAMGKR